MSVFVVPIFDRWLVYAPLLDTSALINRAAHSQLRADADNIDAGLADLRAALIHVPVKIPQPLQGKVSVPFLGLVPTRACNLSCTYCGFGASPSSERMDISTAVAGVNWMAAHVLESGRRTLDVHFFGGEPLVAFEVLEVAVHRARYVAFQEGLQANLEVATNGACSEAQARFVADHFQTVILSFDGFEETHDRRRSFASGTGSFSMVSRTAQICRESPANLCLRICVAEDNVDSLPEIVAWFCDEFHPTAIDFETLQPTLESKRAGLRPPDPYRFAAGYLKARRIALRRGVDAVYAAGAIDEPRLTLCPVGTDAMILHPDGRLSACYLPEPDWHCRGLDLMMGVLRPDGTLTLDPVALQRVRQLVAEKPRCRHCFCRWTCAGACHVNHSYPGCPNSYDDQCIQTRLVTACRLLQKLDFDSLARELLENRQAMERLALQADDRLHSDEAARA